MEAGEETTVYCCYNIVSDNKNLPHRLAITLKSNYKQKKGTMFSDNKK